MAYILKDSTQGQVAVKLTDAGRKKLSEGNLNIELFQLGDSEYCYDCYSTLPTQYAGIHIQQANFNAQNLNPIPEKNKAHIKYPIPSNPTVSATTFGPVQAAHTYEEVFNRATPRGFYTGNTGSCCSFSAFTGSAYTLNANFFFPVSAMTGGSVVELLSADTFVNQAFSSDTIPGYTPVVGDLLSMRYIFASGGTGDGVATGVTNCYNLPCTASSAHLFYQIQGGNSSSGVSASNWSGSTLKPLYYTLDRELPNFGVGADVDGLYGFSQYSGAPGMAIGACVRVYPSVSGGTYSAQSTNPMLTWYGADTPIPYWSPGSLSFENNCDVSVKDVKVWNMNINWSESVAGVNNVTEGYEPYTYYGSTGYCGTKEYLGYMSTGQTDTGVVSDYYMPHSKSSSWYIDSYLNTRVVRPTKQKAIAILHYTNQTISNFYGEKFAQKPSGSTATNLGEARDFRISMPWLMWHKKYINSTIQTGCSGATEYGQCFYTDPPGYNVFPAQPFVMQSAVNANMNDNGLRYYYLYDDNAGPGANEDVTSTVGPNPVGKVFPDLKMCVIHDEELVAAMSYKSNRSWTLPAPNTNLIPAGSNCIGSASTMGIFDSPEQRIYLTYLMESNSGLTTGLHCNYYLEIDNPSNGATYDLEVKFGVEFPYLKPFNTGGPGGVSGGTGWHANRVYLLWQRVNLPNSVPSPHLWTKTEITEQLTGAYSSTVAVGSTPLSGCQMSSASTTFYLTKANMVTGTTYNLNDYITIPSATTESDLLQFGDEYFFYGDLQTDIMATIYEMRYYINLSKSQFGGNIGSLGAGSSLNPSFEKYLLQNEITPNIYLTEIGLFNNDNGFPTLMAIAKFMNPQLRHGAQQFVVKLDF